MFEALRYFVLVVEHGSFTAAARQARLTQPAMSAALRTLEERLGAQLLDRRSRGVVPTAAGEALLPRARAALTAVEDGRRAVAEVTGLRAGTVRLGGGPTACTYYLPPLLAAFRAAHPGVRIVVRELPAGAVLAGLEGGELDLGVVFDDLGEPWGEDELVLVAAPTLAAGTTDVGRAPFVTFAKGTSTRGLLDQHFPQADVAMELGSIASVKGNVRAGVGVALVSRRAVERDVALGHLVVVPHPATPIVRPVSLVHRGVDRLPPAAAALRKVLLSARQPAASRRTASRRRGRPRS